MEQRKKEGWFASIVNLLIKICEIICVSLLCVIFVMTIVQVFCRFIISHPLLWSEELIRYLGIWMVILSTAITILKRSHMSIDILVKKWSQPVQRALCVFSDAVVAFVTAYMIYAMQQMCVKFVNVTSTALKVPMGVVYIGILVGWCCCLVVAIYNLSLSIYNIAGGGKK